MDAGPRGRVSGGTERVQSSDAGSSALQQRWTVLQQEVQEGRMVAGPFQEVLVT